MGLALAVPSLATTLVGFALAGLGVATLIPAVMHAADELPGLPHGVGLTVVSWLLRVGFLVSPMVVGLVADAAGLRVALLGVVLAGLVVVVCGRFRIGCSGPNHEDRIEAATEAAPLVGPSGCTRCSASLTWTVRAARCCCPNCRIRRSGLDGDLVSGPGPH